MSEETKTENKSEPKNESKRRGGRGEIGPHNIKGLYHSFQRSQGRKASRVSMKEFAHNLAEDEKATEEEKGICLKWFKNKAEQKRSRR